MLVSPEGGEKMVTVFQKKFANDAKHLLDLQKDFQSKEDFYNKEGLSQSDKETAKVNRDIAKAKYEKALATMYSYLKGESYVKNHWIGQLLINREYLKWLSPNKENLSI
jgi:Skp family chaperone for outer membrane proteins